MEEFFLRNEEINIIKLFTHILKHPTKQYDNSELLYHLNLSASYLKILYRELDILKEKYNQFNFIKKSDSIVIELNKNFSLTDVYYIFLKSSLNYKLLTSLYFDTFHSQFNFSQNVNYSTRTIQRSAKKLQNFLNFYNININFKKKNPLVGQEFLIRFFF